MLMLKIGRFGGKCTASVPTMDPGKYYFYSTLIPRGIRTVCPSHYEYILDSVDEQNVNSYSERLPSGEFITICTRPHVILEFTSIFRCSE